MSETITILRKSWESSNKDLYIYQVHPQDIHNTILEKHPVYNSYSVFSQTNLLVGDTITVDLEPKRTGKGTNFYVKKVYFKFPETIDDQWSYLDRIAANEHFKGLVKHLKNEGFLDDKTLPLNKITNSIYAISDEGDVVFSENGKILSEILSDENPNISLEKYKRLFKCLNDKQKSSQLISLLGEAGECFTDLQIEKIVNQYPTPKDAFSIMMKNPFNMIQIDGFGFKIVDTFREKLSQLYPENPVYFKDSEKRVFYGVQFIIQQEITKSGNTLIAISEFMKIAISDLDLPADIIEAEVEKHRIDPNLSYLKETSLGIVTVDNFVTTVDYWNCENLIYKILSKSSGVSERDILRNFDEKLEKFLETTDFEPSDEQLEAFYSVKNSKFSLLVGPGGTGKTKTVSELINFLKQEKLKVQLIAPTGKAAQTLSSYAGFEASTIHHEYMLNPNKNGAYNISVTALEEKFKKSTPDIVFIDEFSMVDSALFGAIMQLIHKDVSKFSKTRWMFIGDEFQLPSVGPGNLLHLFIKKGLLKTTRLTKSFRVKSGNGGIAQLSEEFRSGYFSPKDNGNKPFVLAKDLIAQNINDQDMILAQVLNAYNKMLTNNVIPEDIMVLTPVNKNLLGQLNLNNHIQTLIRDYQKKNPLDLYLESKVFGVEVKFYKDDLVLFQNNRRFPKGIDVNNTVESFPAEDLEAIPVNNGDVGKIIDISGYGVIVENLVTKERVQVFAEDLSDELRLGYSYTIHKSQGSESKYGIMIAASQHNYSLNANLLYTGITRFKERCYLFGSFRTIRQKVRVFENKSRNTVLEYLVERERENDVVF